MIYINSKESGKLKKKIGKPENWGRLREKKQK